MSSNIKIKKICQHCGQEFIARTTVTKYCGDNCAKKAYKVKVREEKIKSSEKQLAIQKESIKPKSDLNSYFALKTLDYLTVKEAAVLLKCDCRTIYLMVKSKRLPSINLSQRKTRILKKDIDALFETSQTIKNPSQELPINKSIEETPIRDCFTIGQIQSEYNISETSLQSLIRRHEIPKFQKGKFVYVPKRFIQPILNKNVNWIDLAWEISEDILFPLAVITMTSIFDLHVCCQEYCELNFYDENEEWETIFLDCGLEEDDSIGFHIRPLR